MTTGEQGSAEVDEAMVLIDRLASEIGPRRPTGPAERRAAELVAELLRSRGVAAALEPFAGYSSFGLPFGAIMGAAVVPALLPKRLRRFRSLIAGLAAAALVSEGSLIRTPLSDSLSTRESQNVVATIEPHGDAARTLCLLAHLDTSRSGLIFDPRFVAGLGWWITANSVAVIAAAASEPFGGARPRLGRVAGIARAGLTGSLALLLERELRGVDVPGANDNASGCAVVATLAARLAAEPLRGTRVVICLTGCEESGTLGAQAFLEAHDTDDWLFLNFDNVGGAGTVRYLRREGVITHWDADHGLIATAEEVAASRPELVMAPEDSPAGLTYDTSPILARGGRALTLSVQDGSIPNLHWPTDTYANVDRGGVGRTLAAGAAMIAAIDAGSAD